MEKATSTGAEVMKRLYDSYYEQWISSVKRLECPRCYGLPDECAKGNRDVACEVCWEIALKSNIENETK